MSTRSMYETIMDLPLFKGVSADHVSTFLEKTKVDFKRFLPGDVIVEKGKEVKTVNFLISGKLRVTNEIMDGAVSLSHVFEGNDAIGATRLFGLHPNYEAGFTAVTPVSLMTFSKEKYVRLLKSDSIYIMNFANLLSREIQGTQETFRNFRRLDIIRLIAEWLLLFTRRQSEEIILHGLEALKSLYGDEFVTKAVKEIENRRVGEVKEDELFIYNRDAILLMAENL